MSEKQKLDLACELFRQAIKKAVPCSTDVQKKWVEMSLVSSQKKNMLAKQNASIRG